MSVSSITSPNSNFGTISRTQSKKYIPGGVVLTSRLYSGTGPSPEVTAAGAIPGQLISAPPDAITSGNNGNSRMLRLVYQKIGFCSMLRLEAYQTENGANFGGYINNFRLNVADVTEIQITLTTANEPDLVAQLKEDLAVYNISTGNKIVTESQYASSSAFKENLSAKLISVELINNVANQVTFRIIPANAANFGAAGGINPIVGTYLFFNSSAIVL